jgi:hypothetical protein
MLRSAQQLRIGETQDSAFDALRRPEWRLGLLRRFGLRSLSYGGQVARRK